MFEDRTQEKIKAECLSLIASDTGLSALPGSYADATVGAAALQVSELYKALPAVVSMLFVDEDSGGFIDLVGETYFNLTRRPGTRARCSIAFTGDPGTVLAQGTVFCTAGGLRFLLTGAVALSEEGTARGVLEAEKVGAAYNIGAGTIVSMYVNPIGLASYQNEEASGGTDRESDAALLQRIRERRQKPINGGNGWQYRAWAMEVAGVGEAKVVELADGPGTVGVTVVDSNLVPTSQEILQAVQQALDTQRPVGATPSVQAPKALELSVSAQVILSQATTPQRVQEALEASLEEYLAGLIREKYADVYYNPGEDGPFTVIYNRILALLLTVDGVENAAALTVNGETADITVEAEEVPVLGDVEVTLWQTDTI